jgi:transglutaminase-like putative cysteine protease
MKRELSVTFFVFMLLSTLTYNCLVAVKGQSQDLGYAIDMSVTFSNNGTSNWTFTKEDKAIGLFMNDTWQTVQLVNHSYPIESLETDEDGNPLAVLQFPGSELEPGKNVSYTVTYNVLSRPRFLPEVDEETSETLDEIPENLREEYCTAEKNWLINDPELQGLANNIAGGETRILTLVKNFVAWINSNVKYKTHEVPLYPNETLGSKEGDCDDKAILLITLCRISGIPAYLQFGCIYLPETAYLREEYWENHVTIVSKRIGWHGWAIVYVPPWGWLPVDLTYVSEGLSNPLNAIRGAAVTMQKVIQYMNVSKTDYVASSRRYREFLLENDFYIHEQDEIISVDPTGLWNELVGRLLPLILIAVIVLTVSVTVVGIVYVTKRKKEPRMVKLRQLGEPGRRQNLGFH